MPKVNVVQDELRRRGTGGPIGVWSACTASDLAIEACLDRAAARGDILLVEATANQVDQRGGYTGMKPADFARFVHDLADRRGFPRERVVLGGDHLGPLTWRKLPAERAMEEAKELVRLFVLAGYSKIHLDASMALGDDDHSVRMPMELVARRAAVLARVAEEAHAELRRSQPEAPDLCYVVGSEVPIPGGATEEEAEALQVTSPAQLEETVAVFRGELVSAGLAAAWEKVVAVVVQPGVEFGDDAIHEYDRPAAAALVAALRRFAPLVLEGHSTDYQRRESLRAMVEDGVAILKVGPGLTFALREGLLALEHIEGELCRAAPERLSRFSEALEAEMLRQPGRWSEHYRGSPEQLRLKRRFSYSDRCRYYLGAPPVKAAVERLLQNLSATRIPATLVSQHLPLQYTRVREGSLPCEPRALLLDRVGDVVDDWQYATQRLHPAGAGPAPSTSPA